MQLLTLSLFFMAGAAVLGFGSFWMYHRKQKRLERSALEEYVNLEAEKYGTWLFIAGGVTFFCAAVYFLLRHTHP